MVDGGWGKERESWGGQGQMKDSIRLRRKEGILTRRVRSTWMDPRRTKIYSGGITRCSEEGRSLDEEIGLNRDGRPPRYQELKSRDRFSRVSRLGENVLGGIREELQGSRALSRAEVSESEGA